MNLNLALKRHEMDIFVEGLNILISTYFLSHVLMVFEVYQKLFAIQLYLSDVPEKSWYSTLPTNNSKAYRLDTLFSWLENTSLFNTYIVLYFRNTSFLAT